MEEDPAQSVAPPLLTVIVPVYNEASTIDELLAKVADVAMNKEVIVVDDGSTDGTAAKVKKWSDSESFRIVRHTCNQGKGRAIRSGLVYARGTYTIVQDADLEYDPNDYGKLLTPLLNGDADVVYGSRYLRRDGALKQSWTTFRLGVCGLNLIVRLLYGVALTDEATCFKVFATCDLRGMDLTCERFEFCTEVTAKACRMGLRICEVPVHYHPRTVAQGKKIRWRDGVDAVASLWQWHAWKSEGRGVVEA